MLEKDFGFFVHHIDLRVARNKSQQSTGIMNCVLVRAIGDINANLRIQFDSPSAPEIPLVTGDTFNFAALDPESGKQSYFSEVYISNDAVVDGSAELIYAKNVRIERLLRVTADVIEEGVLSTEVIVGIAAVPLPAANLLNRINVLIYNDGANTIFVGPAGVTTAGATKGIPVAPASSLSLNVTSGVTLYAISTVAGNSVVVMEGR